MAAGGSVGYLRRVMNAPDRKVPLPVPKDDVSQTPTDRLRAVMAKLRDPDGGCPWDVEQTFATIAPYTIG
ncbi:MAG TPA: hypothetical protein DEB21_10665, partial [Rhodospirillaceae bacterium]|nr:hypothetical protein [Rhodospirillaceae bacterium]